MTLKLNKACDLSSISVLPPQSRRSSVFPSGLESSSISGRSQTASQIRPQQSKMTLSQGASSQHGLYSQFSQNSQDEILTNEKLGSQERENSVRRPSLLPQTSYTREESQMIVSRASNSLVCKRSGQEYKSQISEDLERRIGLIETSLSRLGMILESVQSDIIQVKKGTQEVSLEMQSARKKLFAQDDTLQSMGKVQEDIKMCLKYVSDQLKQITNQENLREIISSLSSALSEKIDAQLVKLQNDLHMYLCKEIQAISCSMKISKQNQAVRSTDGSKALFSATAVGLHTSSLLEVKFPNKYVPKASINSARRNLKEQQKSHQPNVEMGGWTSKHKQESEHPGVGNLKRKQMKASPNQLEQRIVIDSDEESDEGFSCLFKGTVIDDYSVEQAVANTARILRKARRKRKRTNTVTVQQVSSISPAQPATLTPTRPKRDVKKPSRFMD